MVDKEDFIKIKEDLTNSIEKFRNKNIVNKEKFKRSINLLDLYYKINHIKLQNLNYLKYNNIKLIKELNDIIENDKLFELFEFSFNYFYYFKNGKYFGEMKNNLKHGKGTMYIMMVEYMKVTLKIIKKKEKEYFIIKMEIDMKGNLKMIKEMEEV